VNVLLTGSTGLVGRAFLRVAGPELNVTAMVRNAQQIDELDQSIPHTDDRAYAVARLESTQSLTQACTGIDAIVHSAALSSPWGKKRAFESVNVQGTKNLLKAAQNTGVQRFVFMSSSSVYFNFRNGSSMSELHDLPKRFCNDYAASKVKAEACLLDSDISAIILRPRGIFGPHDRAIVPRILGAIRGNSLVLPSARNPTVDMTYADNVALAAINALKTDKAEGVFNISNGQPMQLMSILELLLEQLAPNTRIKTLPHSLMSRLASVTETCCKMLPNNPEPQLTRYSAGLFHYDQSLDISKAKNVLGYQPAVSIEEGVRRYAQWYRGAHATQNI